MQRLVVALLVGLLCAPLLALTACGGGGGAGMGDPYDARMVLQNVITAGQDGDFTKARPHLDVAEWLTVNQDPQAAAYASAPAEEQEEIAKRFFGMVKQITEFANLPDAAAINAAVMGATEDSNPQLKVVIFQFQAPDKEKPQRTITVKAKMRYGLDSVWRLSNIETLW